MEEFKSIAIDLENGIYKLNGKDIGSTVSELHLDFEKGQWTLTTTVKAGYTASGREIENEKSGTKLTSFENGGAIEKTVAKTCEWIQEELSQVDSLGSPGLITDVMTALATLIAARADD